MSGHNLDKRTVGQVLAERSDAGGAHPWLHWNGGTVSFGEADLSVNRHARALASIGISRGDHVAVMLPNSPTFLYVLWGLARLGAVAVLVNTAAKGDLLRYILHQSGARHLVVGDRYLAEATVVVSELPGIGRLIWVSESPELVDAGDQRVGHRTVDLTGLLAGVSDQPVEDPGSGADPHLIMYTSGTTGPSKGVLSAHQHGLSAAGHAASDFGYRPDDVLFTCLPLFHVNALYYTAYIGLVRGVPVALSPRFSARSFWDEVRTSKATIFNTLGAMTTILWNRPSTPSDRDHRVRQCLMVPVSREIYHGFRSRFGIDVVTAFAMTEAFVATIFTGADPPEKIGSIGHAADCADVAVLDADDRPVGTGGVGEIAIRPRHPGIMMSGYYQMPEATAQAWRSGWFHTGDRGYLDSDNYLFFVDRMKDSIRRRGENISSYEVERMATKHPDVAETAAVAVPAEIGDEEVLLFVVPKSGSRLDYAALSAFCLDQMPAYMAPRYFCIVDELPKTATEKVEKHRLREYARNQPDCLWDREQWAHKPAGRPSDDPTGGGSRRPTIEPSPDKHPDPKAHGTT